MSEKNMDGTLRFVPKAEREKQKEQEELAQLLKVIEQTAQELREVLRSTPDQVETARINWRLEKLDNLIDQGAGMLDGEVTPDEVETIKSEYDKTKIPE